MTPRPSDAAPEPSRRARPAIAALGHLAVWTAIYVVASVVCLAQLAGIAETIGAAALVWAGGTGLGVYLLDRVKLRRAWMDPADRDAAPERFAFLEPRAGPVRLLALAALAAAGVAARSLHPLGPLTVLAAAAGVVVYAGRPRRRRARIKDVLVVKNLAVGAGMAGFAALVASAAAAHDASAPAPRWAIDHAAPLALAAVHVAARIFADAILCDVEDALADRRYGTATLPNTMGRARAWTIAAAIRIASALALLAWPPAGAARGAAIAWGVVTLLSTAIVAARRPRHLRDVVDARFGLEAAAVWLAGRWPPWFN